MDFSNGFPTTPHVIDHVRSTAHRPSWRVCCAAPRWWPRAPPRGAARTARALTCCVLSRGARGRACVLRWAVCARARAGRLRARAAAARRCSPACDVARRPAVRRSISSAWPRRSTGCSTNSAEFTCVFGGARARARVRALRHQRRRRAGAAPVRGPAQAARVPAADRHHPKPAQVRADAEGGDRDLHAEAREGGRQGPHGHQLPGGVHGCAAASARAVRGARSCARARVPRRRCDDREVQRPLPAAVRHEGALCAPSRGRRAGRGELPPPPLRRRRCCRHRRSRAASSARTGCHVRAWLAPVRAVVCDQRRRLPRGLVVLPWWG